MTIKRNEAPEVTVEQLDSELREICRELPDRENPQNLYGDCVYSARSEGKITHCLIGEWLSRRRRKECPPLGSINLSESAYDLLLEMGFAREVADRAGHWQEEADGDAWDNPTLESSRVIPWGTVPKAMDFK